MACSRSWRRRTKLQSLSLGTGRPGCRPFKTSSRCAWPTAQKQWAHAACCSVFPDPRSYLFAVDADRLHLPAAWSRGLERDVKVLREAVAEGPAVVRLSNFVVAARNLYRSLVQPAAVMIQGKYELVVVPDGVLHYLPFEVLLSEMPSGSSRIDVAALAYLIRERAVSYAPSMSVVAALESSGRPPSRRENPTLLAYGDPIYTAGGSRPAPTRSFFDAAEWAIGQLPHSRHSGDHRQRVFAVTCHAAQALRQQAWQNPTRVVRLPRAPLRGAWADAYRASIALGLAFFYRCKRRW